MGIIHYLNFIEPWRSPFFLPLARAGASYILAGVATALLLALTVWQSRQGYLARQWPRVTLAGLLPAALLISQVCVYHFWPGDYAWLTGGRGLVVPVLVFVPLSLASAYCRPIEAVAVGLVTYLGFACRHTHNPLTILEGGYLALVLNFFLTQSYRGRLLATLRQPIVALPLATIVIWPFTILINHSLMFGPLLTSLLGASTYSLVAGAARLALALLTGLLLQALYLTRLGKPVPVPSRLPPYQHSLRGQVLVAYLPAATIALITVVSVLIQGAISSATSWALNEAARDAASASQRLARSAEQGQSFLAVAAQEDSGQSEGEWFQRLQEDMELHQLFAEVLLVGNGGEVVFSSAGGIGATTTLTEEEHEVMVGLSPTAAAVAPLHRASSGPIITLISPLGPRGRLLGRISPAQSVAWQDILSDLQWTVDAGTGFVVDEQSRVIAHPDSTYVLTLWDSQPRYARFYATGTGIAYETQDSSGTQKIVYTRAVAGYPWQVVIEIPKEMVLRLALDLALPMLLVTGILAALGTLAVWYSAWRYSQPLVQLAATAGEIATGDLSVPVEVSGHDEIGHLGRSFDEMRRSLHRRLSDLALLLEVTQSVSSSRDWSFQPILRAAMTGTQAVAACICLDDMADGVVPVAQEGEFRGWDEILPQMEHIARDARERQRPIPVNSIVRYLREVSPETVAADVRSAICLPLVAGERVLGVMWALYASRRHFDEQEAGLLATLAAQAAVVYENNRLLTEAQGERGRLHAILASTSDPIVVVDKEGRLVLANPAAEERLSLRGRNRRGSLSEVIPDASLRILLEAPDQGGSITRQLHLADGTTYYASASSVALSDGGSVGRVIVLRDITELKRREHSQADFVAKLSRDLRSPLNYLRGYASMIPRVGAVNKQQSDFVERILLNVDYASGLLDSLIDLNNIELGEGARLERCSVAGAIEAALATLRLEIERREHNVRLSLPQPSAVVEADRNLLVRAITCLVDNAAKYMSPGGTIGIQVRQEDNGVLLTVTDTGIGIAPADQMRIFDRFYRVNRAEVQSVPGYGLGLAIVKAVAAWHGGKIWLESELGRGSRFHLWLPHHEGALQP